MIAGVGRRGILGGGVALSALGSAGAIQAAQPDAELLRLCAEHQAHDAAAHDPDAADPVWEAAQAAAWDTVDLIEPIQPRTLAGLQAKASVALAAMSVCRGMVRDALDHDQRLAMRVLQDLAKGVGA